MQNRETRILSAAAIADMLVSGGRYQVRTFRLGDEDVEVLPEFVLTRLRVQHHRGRAVSVSPMDYEWAEADPRQEAVTHDGILTLVCEDFQMDIEISSIPGTDPDHLGQHRNY